MIHHARFCLLTVISLLLGRAYGASESLHPEEARDYWPTSVWKVASAEDHGMDATLLRKGMIELPRRMPRTRSFLVVRNGYIVVEKYFRGATAGDEQNIMSASKSFISAIVGAAMKSGHLRSTNQALDEFFQTYLELPTDPRKKAITLQQLLTMTSGIGYTELYKGWMRADDRLEFTLQRPLDANPGETFGYSDVQNDLLAAALVKATGASTWDFANEHLFQPIGMNVRRWDRNPEGFTFGGSQMSYTPRDIARFGFLYLNNGCWDGKEIIPSSWVKASTSKQSPSNYGYNWSLYTLDGHDAFVADGFGGEFLFVIPDLDLVVVLTSVIVRGDNSIFQFVRDYIIPAVGNSQQSRAGNPAKLSLALLDTARGLPTENGKSALAPTAPSVDEILERYVAATGGMEAHEKITSRHIRAKTTQSTGDKPSEVEVFEKAPDKWLLKLRLPNGGEVREGYDGSDYWWHGADKEVIQLNKKDAAYRKTRFVFHRDVRLHSLFPKMNVEGQISLGAREAYVVHGISGEGTEERFYFDTRNGLLLRNDYEEITRGIADSKQEFFDDYRSVDGIRFPFVSWQPENSHPGTRFEITEFRQNVKIEDSVFAIPAPMR